MSDISEGIKDLIAEIYGDDPAKVTDDAMLSDDLGFDSLDAVELTMGLEEEFQFPADDGLIKEHMRVKDVVAVVEARLAARGGA